MRACVVVGGVALLFPVQALAKEVSFRSPSGRAIYAPDDRFGEALNQRKRRWVVEVATGAGPEGNLAMLLGAINVGFHGFELYGGVGIELNPAMHYTFTMRYYVPGLGSFRPYAGLGYLLSDSTALDVISHNAFAELGHKWILHSTYHLTVGAGVRWVGKVVIGDDSTLRADDVDRALLAHQVDEVMPRWVPTFAIRLSRAF